MKYDNNPYLRKTVCDKQVFDLEKYQTKTPKIKNNAMTSIWDSYARKETVYKLNHFTTPAPLLSKCHNYSPALLSHKARLIPFPNVSPNQCAYCCDDRGYSHWSVRNSKIRGVCSCCGKLQPKYQRLINQRK